MKVDTVRLSFAYRFNVSIVRKALYLGSELVDVVRSLDVVEDLNEARITERASQTDTSETKALRKRLKHDQARVRVHESAQTRGFREVHVRFIDNNEALVRLEHRSMQIHTCIDEKTITRS